MVSFILRKILGNKSGEFLNWNILVFKDRFGDVDPINTKLYYDKIRQNAVDQASV